MKISGFRARVRKKRKREVEIGKIAEITGIVAEGTRNGNGRGKHGEEGNDEAANGMED
jgi:hypothetical protein